MKLKPLLVAAVVVGVLGLAVWGFLEGQKELTMEREREKPVKAPLRVVTDKGEHVVVLDEKTRARAGLGVATPIEGSHRAQVQGFGTVLGLQELVDLRNNYTATRAQAEKARITLSASGREYQRLKILHGEDHAISDKAFQAAEATWRSDEATARAAEQALNAVEQNARQQFGATLAHAAVNGAPLFQRLAQQQAALLQVTLPAGTRVSAAPAKARLEFSDGTTATADLVSTAPRTDPRLQGQSFYYIAPSTALFPGMTVSVWLATGPETEGLKVPADAVVWWQGLAWVYAQQAPDRYLRVELPTDSPAENGWFVRRNFADGKPLVTRGAQMLLSEELRSQIQVGEEGEKK